MYQGNAYSLASVMPAALDTGLFDNATVTIQAPTGILTLSGAPDLTSGPNNDGYVDVTGMAGIRCMLAPDSIARITADETKTATETQSFNTGHLLMGGCYSAIQDQTDWRAVVTFANGDVGYYDILGAESDSQSQMTRLKVEIVDV